MKVQRFIITSLLSLLLTGCANSSFMLERGESSYKKQDYRQAFLRLEPVAKAGNQDAQYAIAYMYYYGQGVVEDRRQAMNWMKESAKQGNSDAIKALSLLGN